MIPKKNMLCIGNPHKDMLHIELFRGLFLNPINLEYYSFTSPTIAKFYFTGNYPDSVPFENRYIFQIKNLSSLEKINVKQLGDPLRRWLWTFSKYYGYDGKDILNLTRKQCWEILMKN